MIDHGKHDVLGVRIDAVDLDAAVARIADCARRRAPLSVTALAVHGVVEATGDPALRAALNGFDLVIPDGQPVRWALNALYGLDLPDKVPGPTVVDRLLDVAATEQLRVFFYGSTPATLDRITGVLGERFGGRLAVSTSPSLFAPVGRSTVRDIAQVINATGAHVCFVGLGCPRQERFVASAAEELRMPALAVGAAFDYIAGTIQRAPVAVQRAGLEWLYRTKQEPRRLARRYLTTNRRFAADVARQLARQRVLGRPVVIDLTDKAPQWDLVDA